MWTRTLEGWDWQAGEEVLIGVWDADGRVEDFRGENGRARSRAPLAIWEVGYINRELVVRGEKEERGLLYILTSIRPITSNFTSALMLCAIVPLINTVVCWCCLLVETLWESHLEYKHYMTVKRVISEDFRYLMLPRCHSTAAKNASWISWTERND